MKKFFLSLALLPGRALAQDPPPPPRIDEPIRVDTLAELAVPVLNFMFVLIGALAVIMIIVSGIRYITSAGSPDAMDRAKKGLLYSAVGIIIAIFSFVVVRVLDRAI